MNPSATFAILIATAQSLVAAVTTRDDLHLRPALASKTVAARLVSGLRVLRAFLRRLIILIALEMEWTLVDARGPMQRPHGRKAAASSTRFALNYFGTYKAGPWLAGDRARRKPPAPVHMGTLYAQLDYLAQIASNPVARAKRLAFHLARDHEGMIIAPEASRRIAGRWGTQVRASFDAMAAAILTKSRDRPPPLSPRRTHWPTINAV
jgi:hypothetical protein